MNILYLCDEYPPGRHGGIGTVVQSLARQMLKRGHRVIVVGFYDWGYGGKDEFDDQGVKVYRFRRKLDSSFFAKKDALIVRAAYRLLYAAGIFQWDISASLIEYKFFLETLIERFNIEIIEMPDFNEYVQYCRRYTPFPKLSKPTIVKLHGTIAYFLKETGQDVPSLIWEMEKTTIEQSTALTSVSSYTARKTAEYYSYKKPITVLYNGIDSSITLSNVNKKELQVAFSGSLVAKKGIFQLIKAWNIVHENIPNARLLIFGKGVLKRVKKYLKPGVESSVYFKGHVPGDELYRNLAESQLAVYPSYAETFGMTVLEAMNLATPVIYTTRATGPEIISDGIDGVLVDPDNVDELAGKIIYLLNNPEICRQLSTNAKLSVKTKFDISITTQKNISFYETILKK